MPPVIPVIVMALVLSASGKKQGVSTGEQPSFYLWASLMHNFYA